MRFNHKKIITITFGESSESSHGECIDLSVLKCLYANTPIGKKYCPPVKLVKLTDMVFQHPDSFCFPLRITVADCHEHIKRGVKLKRHDLNVVRLQNTLINCLFQQRCKVKYRIIHILAHIGVSQVPVMKLLDRQHFSDAPCIIVMKLIQEQIDSQPDQFVFRQFPVDVSVDCRIVSPNVQRSGLLQKTPVHFFDDCVKDRLFAFVMLIQGWRFDADVFGNLANKDIGIASFGKQSQSFIQNLLFCIHVSFSKRLNLISRIIS